MFYEGIEYWLDFEVYCLEDYGRSCFGYPETNRFYVDGIIRRFPW